MSDIQVIMKFELLPNEILIECFEYLNAIDIFHSFSLLNYRFNRLICTIPLHLDFENNPQSIFDQFCMKISQNPEMKKQIYSLHLSNKNTCWQIQPFLSRFSLDEFVHLRSLTLIEVKGRNIEQLKSILPSIPQLSCFRLIDHDGKTDEIISVLPMAELRILMLTSRLPQGSNFISALSSITHLTLSSCYLDELIQILKTASELKYLNVDKVRDFDDNMKNWDQSFFTKRSIHLKQLIIGWLGNESTNLLMLLKQTPNLTNLTISSDGCVDIIDAYKWEDVITSSLLYLNIFKFKFQCFYDVDNITIVKEFQKFRSDFWQKQHHWYTEYSLSNDSALIYTIPFGFDTFELEPYKNRYFNEMINNINTFDNVISLTIDPNILTHKSQYNFSHAGTIILKELLTYHRPLLEIRDVESLKMIINLSNVKHLTISRSCKLQTSSVLLNILKQAPQMSSLSIDSDCLLLLIEDNELCKYLSNMIKNLQISYYSRNLFGSFHDLDKFCKAFSNIEQLTYDDEDAHFMLYQIKHLPSLVRLTHRSTWIYEHNELTRLNDKIQALGEAVFINCFDRIDIYLFRQLQT